MDSNYSRWMSVDPDAPVDEPEEEKRRFSFPGHPRSVVASGVVVGLIALGGGALARSVGSDDSAVEVQAVQTATAEPSPDPGAASVQDATDDESTSDDPTTSERPAAPPRIERRQLRAPGPPPGPRFEERRLPPPPAFDDSDDSDDD